MNVRTRLALTLLVSALPEKQVDVSRVDRIKRKIDKVRSELDLVPLGQGRMDMRDLLLALLDDN